MKPKSFLIYLFFLLTTALSFLVSINILIPRFVWINEPVHSTVEAFGALSAIFVAIMLLHRKHEEGGGRLCWMAIGLLSMGLLLGFHSVARIGHGFVLLYSVACFSGGFWFSLVWFPESDRFSRIRISKWIPWIVAAGSVLFGVWTLLFRETLPLMVEDGKFTHAAILLNLLAGVFFLAATVRFMLDFYRSGKKESFLFSCMTLLFGLANLLFPFSAVWDNIWWFWHLPRVLAFVLVLWFVLKSDRQMISVLKETRDYLENLLNYTNAPIIVWNPAFRITRFNHAFERLTGYKADEVIGKELGLLFPEASRKDSMDNIILTSGGEFWESVEIPILRKDGDIRIALWNSANIYAEGGKTLMSTIAQGQDITERKKAEEQIRQGTKEWEDTFDSISDPLFIHDREFRVLKANRAYMEASGMSFEGMVGRPYYEVFPKMNGPFNGCRRAFELQEEEEEEEEEVSLPSIDKVYKVKFYPVTDVNGSYLHSLHILEDITEHKKLEAQLRHAQKMEAVGTLVGGIAHDFNNILTAIIGYASLLQMKLGEDDPLRVSAEHILASADRAARLTQSLLAFSRKQILNPEVININEVIKRVEKLLSRLISEDIELRTILSDEKLAVFADSAQIEQILMNLATNARDAMPEGGLLSIETEKIELDAEFIKRHGYGKSGPYALISVSDTGIGMDKKTKERIFEPFFTTKEVGKGTGLGLSIVYGIVKQHDGYINGYSEVNKGTTFKIYLPLTKAEVMEIKTREEVLVPEGGTETILLAEDDEGVRDITVSALKEFGYKVVEAVDGEDAVNKFIKNKDEIRLVLLDVVMPKKNGSEAYEEMRKIAPGIKALFMSGYTEDVIYRKKIIDEGLNFVSKPMSPTKLLRLVREILDK